MITEFHILAIIGLVIVYSLIGVVCVYVYMRAFKLDTFSDSTFVIVFWPFVILIVGLLAAIVWALNVVEKIKNANR